MKKRVMWIVIGLIVLIIIVMTDYGAKMKKLRIVAQMGNGINIGNSLDVVGLRERKPEASIEEFEVYWGNPLITKELFGSIAEKDFKTVRIPVSFSEHMDETGKIESTWMNRVKEVTDWALEAGLYVIIDTHHEEWIVPTLETEEEVTEKLCVVWEQIADTFREEGDHLLFEGMNEPRVRNSAKEWYGGTKETREVVNRLNAAFVRTVRESGAENEKRWLLISPYGNSYETEALEDLKIPKDDYIIVAVHGYIPYSFTLDEEGKNEFEPEEDTERIDQLMEDIERIFQRKGIPVMITEFGCHEKPDDEERSEWAQYYTNAAGKIGVPCIWWDNGKDSKIIDRSNLTWPHEELTDILLRK